MATNVDRLRSALSYLDPNMGRDDWVTVAMGIKSSLGEEGFSTFDDWSKRGDSYNVADTRDTWRSINRTGGVTEASVFYKARAMGWRDDGTRHEPTPEEQEARRRKAEKAEAAKARLRARAAGKAAGLWEAAKPAPADNPYLTRKGVAPVATLREIPAAEAAKVLGYPPESRVGPLDGRLLVVPVKIGDEIRAVELIDGDGRKHALAGGKKSGGCWSTDPPPDGDGAGITLLIGEGVATVLSAQEATGHLAVATLTSGNLVAVAREMRGRYPAAKLVILADLIKATGEQDPHAEEAARAVGGTLVVPRFSEPRDPSHTDLNDFAAVCGMEAVRDLIDKAEPPGQEADQDQASEDPIPPLSKRPCFRVFDEWLKDPKTRPGVWFFGASQPKKAEEPPILTQQWVCSPLYIDAVTFDGQSNNFGRLLRFKNTIGTWRQWGMPMEMLRGFGEELRGALLAMGVEIDPQSKLLGQYLQSVHPKRRVHCALQVGWCGGSFVLPDEVVGPGASGVIFQSGERRHDEYPQAGTLAGWRSGVAARAHGNPLLVQTISASFAGPMLMRCGAEGGGMHFTGHSSIGKTAAIAAACSTWGGANFRRSWKATANGMEGAAAMFNDGLLALDEIGECDPREAGAIVYALANGVGKQRASRTGSARTVTRWRCFVLSSGERSVATHMLEGGRQAKAGQSVRLLDVPVSGKFGAWDNLHGLLTGAAFSDELSRAAVTHYGHAGRAFLEKLTRDTRNFCEWLERIKALPEFSVEGGEGQDKRAAARFALVALAGEVATEYGITGWEEGTAIKAAAKGFKAWRSLRGRGNDERWKILEAVSDFIDRHGDSRFSSTEIVDNYGRDGEKLGPDTRIGAQAIIRDRAGWWQGEGDARVYLFTADGMGDALAGFDLKPALDTLQEAGAMPPSAATGERSTPRRIGGRLVRLYTIRVDKLKAGHVA